MPYNFLFLLLILICVAFQPLVYAKLDELCPQPINSVDKPNAEEKHCECATENSSQWGDLVLIINCSEMDIDYLNGSVAVLPENSVSLDLSYNRLRKLPFFRGDDLKVLDASYNEIIEIEDYNFAGLPKLDHLHLSRNKIELVSVNAFSGLTNLVELDLSQQYSNVIFKYISTSSKFRSTFVVV